MEEEKIKEKNKLPKTNHRVFKYFKALKQGKTKTEASIIAGYPDPNHTTRIEKTKGFQVLERYYKHELLNQISLQEIAEVNARNIRQERDIGGSNTAIKLALEKIEPDQIREDDFDKVIVVLSK
ncbi:hypothetical protein A3D36_01380 [Candidatus Nomurabacteria bacterium RIFCSPHIGHO2_02_FULL_36_29]|nr:MAG: hypothetical protein A3D36_01380 [Candidatus Nomurabacteria bacterium RIFCSPHIGHO2_02_FULL_36_29]OGI94708.1 MAG: hypothetical protein A3I84_00205 [Candidatus Nomurabacteria bacterium RIFCSPLOWO2_02_FULL_36_8]